MKVPAVFGYSRHGLNEPYEGSRSALAALALFGSSKHAWFCPGCQASKYKEERKLHRESYQEIAPITEKVRLEPISKLPSPHQHLLMRQHWFTVYFKERPPLAAEPLGDRREMLSNALSIALAPSLAVERARSCGLGPTVVLVSSFFEFLYFIESIEKEDKKTEMTSFFITFYNN